MGSVKTLWSMLSVQFVVSSKSPISRCSHMEVSKLPNGSDQKSILVSYNTNAFESYSLKGNLNSRYLYELCKKLC